MTPSERAPARRRAAALAVLAVLAGGCADAVPTTTPVDPIVLREDVPATPGGVAGADPVPLPDPEPAGATDASDPVERDEDDADDERADDERADERDDDDDRDEDDKDDKDDEDDEDERDDG